MMHIDPENRDQAAIVLVGTLDTKGAEYDFVREILLAAGRSVLTIDTGILGEPSGHVDVSRQEVAEAAGHRLDQLVEAGDRGEAIEAMAVGAEKLVTRLHGNGRVAGVMALGGTGGTALATRAMRSLPVGVPKLMVSTVASGDTTSYVGAVDLTMMHSVVDIAGLNKVSRKVLANAATAVAGMSAPRPQAADGDDRPLVAATMFGVTTPGVQAAKDELERLGYEVLVFHATGTGGQSMEALVRDGTVVGVLDLTTTELADELVGGVFSAGPDRLRVAGTCAVPQVVSLGALDMVNFGPPDSVPPRFQDRLLYRHNPSVTLMRTTPEETAELGRRVGERLSAAVGPVAVFVPHGGISLIATPGQPFHDEQADEALFAALADHLDPRIECVHRHEDINSAELAVAMAHKLDEQIKSLQDHPDPGGKDSA